MKTLFIFLFTLFVNSSFGQQSLENYKGLQSKGFIPQDFTTLSTDKYLTDYENNTDKSLDKEFYLKTRFFIDGLLLSGKVIFNDTLSNYVKQVAEYVLKDNPKLYNKLRFYTIKSTVSNAFSTDQGIIFVTTGLVAQLAFILAHEISHYTEKRVMLIFMDQCKKLWV